MDITKRHINAHDRGARSRSGDKVVCAPLVRHFLRSCEALGIALEQLLAGAGITEAELNPPGGWVRHEVAERLLRYRLQQVPDPILGLRMATAIEPAMTGVVGFMTLCCPSLLELHNTVRDFGRLVSNVSTTWMVHEPGAALWCIDILSDDEHSLRHGAEWFLGAYAALISKQNPRALLAVHVGHEPSLLEGRPHPEYAKIFPCPIHFNQRRSALVLDPQYLNSQSPFADPVVYESLREQAKLLLGQLGSGSNIADRVRQELRLLLAEGKSSRDEVAARLGVSTRHLHRQLQIQNCSYQLILDELRAEIAQKQLCNPECDLDELSAELGFSGNKSFARWFIARLGLTPVEFRRRHAAPMY